MTDRIDPSSWPSPRGPWPEVTDLSRLYDAGQPWCVNAHAHPDYCGAYPDPDRHMPWHECRGREAYIDDVRSEIDGDEIGLSAYVASSFRFGQPRDGAVAQPARVVVETWRPAADEPSQRISLSPGDALRLARILVRLADDLIFVPSVG